MNKYHYCLQQGVKLPIYYIMLRLLDRGAHTVLVSTGSSEFGASAIVILLFWAIGVFYFSKLNEK